MINNTIVGNIKNHADKEGGGYNNWYCGIASDPNQRLFNDHNVPKEKGKAWWIKENANSEQDARDTEERLLSLGFDGGEGGGDNTTIYVYVYKKIRGITQE